MEDSNRKTWATQTEKNKPPNTAQTGVERVLTQFHFLVIKGPTHCHIILCSKEKTYTTLNKYKIKAAEQ